MLLLKVMNYFWTIILKIVRRSPQTSQQPANHTPRDIKYENTCQGLWQCLYYRIEGIGDINIEYKYISELVMEDLKNISITISLVSSPTIKTRMQLSQGC
jgi:hypothetical protein